MNPRFAPTFVLLAALAALTGCGNSKNATSSTATTANGDPTNIGCANPVGIDAVPAEWQAVAGREMISGSSGYWQLTKVVLHSAMPRKGGGYSSASTTTLVGNDPIQSVDCKDLADAGTMSVSIQPWDKISDADGGVDTRRNIRFGITPDGVYKTATTERVNVSAKFGVESEDSRRQEADARAVGVVYQAKTYRISPTEMEIRLHAEVPNQDGSGGTLYFNSAMHYVLRNP